MLNLLDSSIELTDCMHKLFWNCFSEMYWEIIPCVDLYVIYIRRTARNWKIIHSAEFFFCFGKEKMSNKKVLKFFMDKAVNILDLIRTKP